MSEGPTIRLRPGAVSWREADGEVIALDLGTSDYLGVNATGAALWTRIAEGSTAAELVGVLQAQFDVSADRAAADVAAFVGDLRTRGLLET
ncbi:PqqD family protein [Geodermatophilaceae bacterium NBWT11]|nr:PqqD family protein [Geodermatophilaceae bacterium NBWT11]